jgi:hypothetical protein
VAWGVLHPNGVDEYRAGRRESLGNPLEFARWVGFDEHIHFDGAGPFWGCGWFIYSGDAVFACKNDAWCKKLYKSTTFNK